MRIVFKVICGKYFKEIFVLQIIYFFVEDKYVIVYYLDGVFVLNEMFKVLEIEFVDEFICVYWKVLV